MITRDDDQELGQRTRKGSQPAGPSLRRCCTRRCDCLTNPPLPGSDSIPPRRPPRGIRRSRVIQAKAKMMQEPNPAKLVVISGVLTGQVYPLDSTTTTFGRDTSNTSVYRTRRCPGSTASSASSRRRAYATSGAPTARLSTAGRFSVSCSPRATASRRAGVCYSWYVMLPLFGAWSHSTRTRRYAPTTSLVPSDVVYHRAAGAVPPDCIATAPEGAAGDQHCHPCDSRRRASSSANS